MGKNLSSNTNITPLEEENRTLNDVGKGIPLNQLHPEAIIYMIEFKSRRIDFFYFDFHQQQQMMLNSPSTTISSTSSHLSAFSVGLGDLVIVEADRGKDLGKIAMIGLTSDQKELLLQEPIEIVPEQIFIKRIYRLATPEEINMLLIKSQDEQRALVICQQKVKQRKLQMEVVDAEYQWDRRKLTFYFEAEKRIDFRDLVREMFKIYKTRIWM
ncbi:PSP1 C-terminal conserved region-domain-containing protein [Cunninghamella echinulata]|nr:PSP1 C-terminal conserved region-domain-containing protein [Cunninghamella echinulata]